MNPRCGDMRWATALSEARLIPKSDPLLTPLSLEAVGHECDSISTNMYAGRYFRCTIRSWPIGGSSRCRMMSIISLLAPFVISRSAQGLSLLHYPLQEFPCPLLARLSRPRADPCDFDAFRFELAPQRYTALQVSILALLF